MVTLLTFFCSAYAVSLCDGLREELGTVSRLGDISEVSYRFLEA